MHGNHPQTQTAHNKYTPEPRHPVTQHRVDWTTWWLWRGARTRSHPELGRENPQRPWYCVSRHGRVGRRQVLQSTLNPHTTAGWSSPVARQAHNLKVTGSNPVPATKQTYIATETPPSTGMAVPVTESDAGDAKNAADAQNLMTPHNAVTTSQ